MRAAPLAFTLLTAALPVLAQPGPHPTPQTAPLDTPQAPQAAPVSEVSRLDKTLQTIRVLASYFNEEEINILYAYYRDRLIGSLTGREEFEELPPDLMFRMKILEKQFEREGKKYLEDAMRELEAFVASKTPSATPAPAAPAAPAVPPPTNGK